MRWMTQLTREQAALKCVYLGHHEPGPHRERATTLDQPPSSLRHHLRRATARRRAVPMRTQEQRHVRVGFPFLAGQDRPPLVGVKVVPPRPAKNTGGCGGSTLTPPTRRAQRPAATRKGKNCEHGDE